jgi:hypothetical protein
MASGRTDTNVILDNCVAGADLSGKQGYFCTLAAGKIVTVSGAGEKAHGVIYGEPTASGQPVEVAVDGEVSVITDGSGVNIAVGDYLKTDASGRAVKAATDKDVVVAKALEVSAAANLYIQAVLVEFTLSV